MKKRIITTLYFIFFAAAVALVIYRLYLRNNNRIEEAQTVQFWAIASLIAALFCRLALRFFPKWFENKQTAEHTDQTIHRD
jgi:TRAP-type C4-dicarboxylate transport system permease small subunit